MHVLSLLYLSPFLTENKFEDRKWGVKIVKMYLFEKVQRHILSYVHNRKNVKISVNRWELKFPKDWDISQSLGNQNSQRLEIFKITASWQFNFGKDPKNNREKARPRPAYCIK
jgi:hypothetical protein